MKQKLILASLLLLAFNFKLIAQDFYHSGGGGIMSLLYNQVSNGGGSVTGGTGDVGFQYNPSLSFDVNRNMQFNIASYPFVGFSLNSRVGGSLSAEVPLVAELNFGDMDDSGGFVGLGLNYGFSADEDFSGWTAGPQISGGGQFEIYGTLAKVRAAFTIGLIKASDPDNFYEKNRLGILSLTALYPLGQ